MNTTTNINLTSVMTKIQKLLSLAEGAKQIGSFNEAEVASRKAAELMYEYQVTLVQLEAAGKVEKEPIDRTLWVSADWGCQGDKSRVAWKEVLATLVAEHCSVFLTVSSDSSNVCFVGTKSNRDITCYLYSYLRQMIEIRSLKDKEKMYAQMAKLGRTEEMKGWRAGFIQGCLVVLKQRFAEERAAALHTYGTGLAVVEKGVEEAKTWLIKASGANLRSLGSIKVKTGAEGGRAAGEEFAKGLALHKGVGAGQATNIKELRGGK